MKRPIKIALLALALAGGSLAAIVPATADNVSIAVGPGGGIAFGYSDGYWDRAHAWHAWRNAREAAAWRAANRRYYYAWRHDRDGDGWRDDRWWEARPVVPGGVAIGVAPGLGVAIGPAGGVAIGLGGGIAFGYRDGYWDRAHAWHAWRNAREAAAWRAENREHYFDMRHDRDPHQGWREERWWDRH